MTKYINKNTPELRNKLLKKGLKMTPLVETKERGAGLLITNTWRVIGVPYDSTDFHIGEYLKNNPQIEVFTDEEELLKTIKNRYSHD